MKALYIERYGGRDRMQLGEVPEPAVQDGDVLIAVRAASINPIDWKLREGQLAAIQRHRFPFVMGSDGAGLVLACGARAGRFQVGDPVYFRANKMRIGTFAERIAVDEREVAKLPAGLDFAQAASLPLVGLTAWQALVDTAELAPGQRVLVHAGSGGVGTFAIQLAKARGAFVGTTCGARNAELARRLGADRVIDYHSERFDEALREYDCVFDTLGGETLTRSFAVIKRGGVLVTIHGAPDGRSARAVGLGLGWQLVFTVLALPKTTRARMKGVRFRHIFMKPDGETLGHIGALVGSGRIVPVIDRVVPLEQAKAAFEYAESGRATGKVILDVGGKAAERPQAA
jgi:alcohol dehydrogenase